MATGIARLSEKSQQSLAAYINNALSIQRQANNELYNKLANIDYNYAMYKNKEATTEAGTDVIHGETVAGDVFIDEFTVPIVISQVDAFVGYLAEVYLTGYPMFPIVSTVRHRAEAEKLEAIIDTHADIGGYARQLLKAFRNGIKYNFMPMLLDWDTLPYYNIASSLLKPTEGAKVEKADYSYNCLKSLDAYNCIRDLRVDPADCAAHGEYAGYTELITRIQLKTLIAKYNKDRTAYNQSQAFSAGANTSGNTSTHYVEKPTINEFITTAQKPNRNMDWLAWAKNTQNSRIKYADANGLYERTLLFARIIPSEHLITNVPEPNTPQIWRLDYIFPGYLISAKRIITFLDLLPIMFGQPLEDGFAMQTHSIAERGVPFQETASKLLNIRFAGARRAVADRALYDPTMIRPSDVNSPVAAPKIPVKIPIGSGKKLGDAYESQPYNDRATEGVVQDAMRVIAFADNLQGGNKATQGEFVKGNKTRKEWEDVMGFSNNRLRLPALMIEHQIMFPMKNQIKMNIFQYGEGGLFQNYRTGEPVEVTAEDLTGIKQKMITFKAADGYTPASKIVPTELLTAGMQLIAQVPVLQEYYGQALPSMFAHMMSVGGVRDFDQYVPEVQNTVEPPVNDNQQ